MMMAVILFLAGLLTLVGGGELLVRGATLIARIAGLTPAVIGLTIVAMGTSLPELAIGLMAVLSNQPDLAIGNVIGSNIFNITAALGITALVHPLPVRGNAVRFEWPVMFGATALCVFLMRDHSFSLGEAFFLVAALVLFTGYSVHLGRKELLAQEAIEFAEQGNERSLHPSRLQGLAAAFRVVVGITLLVIGGRMLVQGASDLARIAGMSERVIGLTVVAIGTGMPELVTSVVAAARRQTDVAVANMIGSNIFNLLGILGVTAAVRPFSFSASLAGSDLWWMLGVTLFLLPVLWRKSRISRIEGAVLTSAYCGYVATLVI